jgi:hypothetical protein
MPWGPAIGYVEVPPRGEEEWITLVTAAEKGVAGVRALWLVFQGEGEGLFSVDWLEFR